MKESVAVRINQDSKNNLIVLAKNSNTSQQQYLSSAINYIYKSGLDIFNLNADNISPVMKKLENRVIGFMKKREQEFFVPMSQKMSALVEKNLLVFEALEALDIISLASDNTTQTTKANNDYIVPTETENNNTDELSDNLKETVNINKSNTDFDLEKLLRENELFKEKLEFLYKRISKGSGLTSGKYICNVTNRDMDVIKKILNGN